MLCRDISKLVPELQEKVKSFLAICKDRKKDVVIIETARTNEVQAAYYAQGRADLKTVNDKRILAGLPVISEKENVKITNTKPGMSKHNSGKAFDVAPAVNGKIMWNDSESFRELGSIGKSVGLKWGGDWKSFKDSPHFEI